MNNTQFDNNLFYFNRLTYITPHEVALAMNGFDYDTENDELTEVQLKEVIRLRKAITRNLQLINEYKTYPPRKSGGELIINCRLYLSEGRYCTCGD
ncbi:hypothetical protein BANRA_03464 [Escherichia coli]|nr:hypothetical protein BANRA_03464 [Escherichia coli]